MKRILLLIGLLLVISGCAKVTVERVDDKDYKEGLRFYRPAPYLLVTNTQGQITSSVVWLPDKTEEYVLKHTNGFGAAELKAKLEGGWNLTEIGISSDSKIPETITGFGELAAGFAKENETKKKGEISPGLYEIVYENGRVSGIKKIDLRKH